MSDNLSVKGPQDRARVNPNESWEVRYWCKKFGCTEEMLRKAVKSVGNSSKKIEEYLSRK